MKKDRNTFFSGAEMSNVSYFPNMQPTMQPNMMYANNQMAPIQASQASQSFYSGPGYPAMNDVNSDIENRIARLERQINRLDNRVTKLEGNHNVITDDSSNYSSSMYMV